MASEADDVLGGGALLPLHDVELDALALGERLEAGLLDRRVVDEAVLLAVLGRDEPEALAVVEPLHGAGGAHAVLLLGVGRDGRRPPDWAEQKRAPARARALVRRRCVRGAHVSLSDTNSSGAATQ